MQQCLQKQVIPVQHDCAKISESTFLRMFVLLVKIFKQGDQIGRIIDMYTIVYFGQFSFFPR
jgi:hypothetical protein